MKLVIFYKTSKASSGTNHYHAGGLASNALHSVNVLRKMNIDAHVVAVNNFKELFAYMEDNPGITHVVIEAVWLTAEEISRLAFGFMYVKIVVRAHSKIGFLQVEPEAIPVIRDIISMSKMYRNLHFSSNNEEFCRSLAEVYGPVLYLPNLYDTTEAPGPLHDFFQVGDIRVASFGASRLLKLHTAACLAALQVSRRLNRPLKFFINVDKTPGGESVRRSIRNLLKDVSWAELREVGWEDPQTFRETIANMHLVYQLSCTETFCHVAADAVASGIPVVVGPAISWIPKKYHVNIDDTSHAAEMGVKAIRDGEKIGRVQQQALKDFVYDACLIWAEFLGITRKRHPGWWIL